MDFRLLFLSRSTTLSSLLLALLAWYFLHRANREQFRLSVLIFIAAGVEVAALALSVYKINNLPLLHVYTVVEFILLAGIFKRPLAGVIPALYFRLLYGAFALYALLHILLPGRSWYEHNAWPRAIEAITLILLVLLFFYNTLKELNFRHLESAPLFWISTGLLFYFSSSFFIFISSNYVLGENELAVMLWAIHMIFTIVRNVFFGIALWVRPRKAKR